MKRDNNTFFAWAFLITLSCQQILLFHPVSSEQYQHNCRIAKSLAPQLKTEQTNVLLGELKVLSEKVRAMKNEIAALKEQVDALSSVLTGRRLLETWDSVTERVSQSQRKLRGFVHELNDSIRRTDEASTDFIPELGEPIRDLKDEFSGKRMSLEPLVAWMNQTRSVLESKIRQQEELEKDRSKKGFEEEMLQLLFEIGQFRSVPDVSLALSDFDRQLLRTNAFIDQLITFVRRHESDKTAPGTIQQQIPVLHPEVKAQSSLKFPKQRVSIQTLHGILRQLGYRPQVLDVRRVAAILWTTPSLRSLREIIERYPTSRKMHWILALVIDSYQGWGRFQQKDESWIQFLSKERINRINEFLQRIKLPYLPEADRLYGFILNTLKEPRYLSHLWEMDASYEIARKIVRDLLNQNHVPRDIIWRKRLRSRDRHSSKLVLTPTIFHWVQVLLDRRVGVHLLTTEEKYRLERELIAEAVLNSALKAPKSKEMLRDLLVAPHTESDLEESSLDVLLSQRGKGLIGLRRFNRVTAKVWDQFSAYRELIKFWLQIEFNSPVAVLHRPLQVIKKLTTYVTLADAEVLSLGFELNSFVEDLIREEDVHLQAQLRDLVMTFQTTRADYMSRGELYRLSLEEIDLVRKLELAIDKAYSDTKVRGDREAIRQMKNRIDSFWEARSVRILQTVRHTEWLLHDMRHIWKHLLEAIGKSYDEKEPTLRSIEFKIWDQISDLKEFRINITRASLKIKKLAEAYRRFFDDEIQLSLKEMSGSGLEVSARDLLYMIDQLGEVKASREESAKAMVRQELEGLITSYQTSDRLKEVSIELTQDSSPSIARISPRSLRKVMRNLLDNAIDAIEGRGNISIRVTENPQINRVFIEIQDSGIGIAPDQIAKIFNPHFTTKTEGTGMGLVIVRETIQFYNGTIKVESRPKSQFPQNHGTLFRISLPLAEPTLHSSDISIVQSL